MTSTCALALSVVVACGGATPQTTQAPVESIAPASVSARPVDVEASPQAQKAPPMSDEASLIARLREDRQKAGDASADRDEYLRALDRERSGDLDGARRGYFELIKSYPQSRYVAHAYFAFAELFFDRAKTDASQWTLARVAYEKVVQYPPPGNPLYGVAWIRLGEVLEATGERTRATSAYAKASEYAEHFAGEAGAAEVAAIARGRR
jgi:TolA-binding protein